MKAEKRLDSAWWALRIALGAVPFLAGLDKFFNLLTDWSMYLSPLTLDVLPTFDMWQLVWLDLPWDAVVTDLDGLLGAGYSVSLFTTWTGPTVSQVWVKGRADVPPPDPPARRATSTVHMIPGMSTSAVTAQLGAVGPWHERLPHFRPSFTPSSGAELQSEYLVPAARAGEAIGRLRARAEQIVPLLQVSEIRSVAPDELWLSGAHATEVVALHFTWRPEWEGVHRLLPDLERLLARQDPQVIVDRFRDQRRAGIGGRGRRAVERQRGEEQGSHRDRGDPGPTPATPPRSRCRGLQARPRGRGPLGFQPPLQGDGCRILRHPAVQQVRQGPLGRIDPGARRAVEDMRPKLGSDVRRQPTALVVEKPRPHALTVHLPAYFA